ncbi:MAG TPA: MBL fold metallo-hydrolase, partial [Blastocatellia bacterium]
MKLTVFQSGMGDCLLLTGADGRRMMIDGGMADAYDAHVSPSMGALQEKNQKLDVVYVSHIDADHISGVLKMMNDQVEWRVHDFQKQNNNPGHQEPEVFRPPEVNEIWHNAFHEQLEKNSGPVEEMLAASAMMLSGGDSKKLRALAEIHHNLTSSIPQAINLSRR